MSKSRFEVGSFLSVAQARPASRHATTADPNAWEPTAAAAAAEAPTAPRAFATTPIPAAAKINPAARVRHMAPPFVAWASRVYQFKTPHPTTIAAVRVATAPHKYNRA